MVEHSKESYCLAETDPGNHQNRYAKLTTPSLEITAPGDEESTQRDGLQSVSWEAFLLTGPV